MLEIGPDDIDILESAPMRFILDPLQKVALHIDCIDTSRILQRLRDMEHVDAAPRTKIGNVHPRLDAKRRDVTPRVRKTFRLQRSLSWHCLHYIASGAPEGAPEQDL